MHTTVSLLLWLSLCKKTVFCAESFRFPLLQRIIIELLWALLSTVITETSFSVLLTQPRVAWQFMFCFLIPCAKWSMLCEFTVKRWQCRCWKSAYLGHSWGSFFTYSSFNTHSYHTPRSMIKMHVVFFLSFTPSAFWFVLWLTSLVDFFFLFIPDLRNYFSLTEVQPKT